MRWGVFWHTPQQISREWQVFDIYLEERFFLREKKVFFKVLYGLRVGPLKNDLTCVGDLGWGHMKF